MTFVSKIEAHPTNTPDKAYAAGTVAEIRWPMTSGAERAIYDGNHWSTESGIVITEPSDVRPLVVLDLDTVTTPEENCGNPAGPEVVQCLRLIAEADMGGWRATVAFRLADQIEAQTKPPRIPEPGLWGVVEAPVSRGRGYVWQWVHHPDDIWLNAEGDSSPWDDLINPTLIREGINA